MEKEKTFKKDYTSKFAKQRYKELQNKPYENLTDEQRSFMYNMYLEEEAQAGML